MTGHSRSRGTSLWLRSSHSCPSVPRVTGSQGPPLRDWLSASWGLFPPLQDTHRPAPTPHSRVWLRVCTQYLPSDKQKNKPQLLRNWELWNYFRGFWFRICTALTQMSLSLWVLTTVVQVWEVSPFPEQLLGLSMYGTPLGGRFVVWTTPLPPWDSFPIWRAKLND